MKKLITTTLLAIAIVAPAYAMEDDSSSSDEENSRETVVIDSFEEYETRDWLCINGPDLFHERKKILEEMGESLKILSGLIECGFLPREAIRKILNTHLHNFYTQKNVLKPNRDLQNNIIALQKATLAEVLKFAKDFKEQNEKCMKIAADIQRTQKETLKKFKSTQNPSRSKGSYGKEETVSLYGQWITIPTKRKGLFKRLLYCC